MTAVLDPSPPTAHPGAQRVAQQVAQHRRRRARRVLVVGVVLAVAVVAVFVLTMSVGSSGVAPLDVLRSVVAPGSDPRTDFIVRELRLPRALTSLLVGLALGISGTVFQRLLANPLASPDVLGIASGASAAAVAGLVLGNLGGLALSGAALAGALATSALVYLLAWRQGISGYRFILVGIGIGALMGSVTSYLLSKAEVADARAAFAWLVGSSGMAGTAQIQVLAAAVVVLGPLSGLLGRRLTVLELGDDTARGLGLHVERDRRLLMLVSVVLVALATAAAGPIAFVALMAGPLAARLVAGAGSGIVASACVGALIVLVADLLGQHLLPVTLSTGVVTGLIGAPYLVWLLIATNRSGAGG
ncbi:FecCD family ABC transporter permease [Cellulomonas edaphi]|uniref:Iron chelate uptake ABC transporter family permease subunit n=1 Tax=Cellulomonas edaphi TaxID=3053468 RepID=A0ABT7SAJ5_9CELL|nr:iron chelate uptake ABC transporter family permease subunit [Cellulomons edaphi]MDM7832640.1 iron chelate uptake ABC transporter family permease subunit [Cellulomons edaphi]